MMDDELKCALCKTKLSEFSPSAERKIFNRTYTFCAGCDNALHKLAEDAHASDTVYFASRNAFQQKYGGNFDMCSKILNVCGEIHRDAAKGR